MITIDASAVLAILLREPEAEGFKIAIARAGGGVLSPVNYWEALVRAIGLRGEVGLQETDEILRALSIEVTSCGKDDAVMAAKAFQLFGKGQDPARLNLGDCFAYALAARQGDGLLFKGDDFPKTDVVRVPT